MTENKKQRYTFHYKLSYDEAYNAFMSLAFRWKKKTKYAIMAALVIVTIFMMILFAMDPDKFYYFFIVIIAVLLTAYVFYYPSLKARKGAKQVARVNGTYEVKLTTDGKITLGREEEQTIKADAKSRAIELQDSFAIRVDALTTVCLPKRIMNENQIDAVRNILSQYIKFSVYDE